MLPVRKLVGFASNFSILDDFFGPFLCKIFVIIVNIWM